MGGAVHVTSFSLLTVIISLSQFLFFFESRENTIAEFFFCYFCKWECKKYICGTLPFTALEVYQLWRLLLLRNPEIWKRSVMWSGTLFRFLQSDFNKYKWFVEIWQYLSWSDGLFLQYINILTDAFHHKSLWSPQTKLKNVKYIQHLS